MKAIIFDLDGTLLNTLADIANACNHMLQVNGWPTHPVPAYAHMVGNGFPTLVTRALPRSRKFSDDELQELIQQARKFYGEHMLDQTCPYAGIETALRNLADKNVLLGVLSNKPDNQTRAIIPHYFADIPFMHVRGARDGVPLKPDPASLLAMLDDMNVSPQKAFYAGDSDVDMFTAHNAGVIGIGAAWGFRGQAELASAGADYICATPPDLVRLPIWA